MVAGEASYVIAMADNVFHVFDCSLVRRAIGESVSTLRELVSAVGEMDSSAVEHHMMRCRLDDRFEMAEFPNDFARWCWEDLGDRITAERLALVNPYLHPSIDELRKEIAGAIEERLWSADFVSHPCRPGMELHLVGSQLVAYDTGLQVTSMTALAEALPRMSLRSVFYHVHDARRRSGGAADDFSSWLETIGADAQLVRSVREIDFYYLSLNQLREALVSVLSQHFPAYQTAGGAAV